MKVKTIFIDNLHIEETLNLIGYENVLNVLPYTEHDTTLFMVICKAGRWEELQEGDK